MKYLLLFVIFTLTATGAACSPIVLTRNEKPYSNSGPETIVIEATQIPSLPIPSPTSTPEFTFPISTYQDFTNGFELDYPANWSFDPGEQHTRGSYVQFFSWAWQPGDPLETIPEGETALSLVVQRWDPKNDLEAFITQRKLGWDSSGSLILTEERITLTGDRPAAQFIIQAADGVRAFFLLTTNGEDYLVISGSGDLDLLKNIAHTLRPIQ